MKTIKKNNIDEKIREFLNKKIIVWNMFRYAITI